MYLLVTWSSQLLMYVIEAICYLFGGLKFGKLAKESVMNEIW